MNERIKLLADEATTYIEPTATSGEGWIFNKEKFAESIVAEMLQTCEDHPAWTGRMIGEEIKQRFGVEV
jgi:hypothetical protein